MHLRTWLDKFKDIVLADEKTSSFGELARTLNGVDSGHDLYLAPHEIGHFLITQGCPKKMRDTLLNAVQEWALSGGALEGEPQ